MNFKALIIGILGLIFGAAGVGAVENVFLEFGTFVAAIALFAEWLIQTVNAKGFAAMLITWGMGMVFAFTGWLLGLGFLAEVTEVWHILVYGVASALVANEVWPQVIKKILEYLGLLEPKE